MANKPSTTNVGKTASPVLDLSENKPNLSSTTKAVETKEQEEQAEKDEDEQEEQDEEQRPSDKDEQEHGGPADPVDEDRLANKEQENKDNGQDENKVNDKHQGRVPSDQDRERQHHEDGHGHREPSRFRPSNPEPNAQRVPKRKYSEEEGSSSNFLTYFLLLTLLFVVGYLILHNKNKLIGYIVEGRPRYKSTRENNRPSHRQYEPLQNVNDVLDIDRFSVSAKN